jgi:hypothetical protein
MLQRADTSGHQTLPPVEGLAAFARRAVLDPRVDRLDVSGVRSNDSSLFPDVRVAARNWLPHANSKRLVANCFDGARSSFALTAARKSRIKTIIGRGDCGASNAPLEGTKARQNGPIVGRKARNLLTGRRTNV